jgi:transcription elongation factor Elf1
MSQEHKHIINCPVCNKPLIKICGVTIGCEVETICCECKDKTKIMARLTQEGWELYQKFIN